MKRFLNPQWWISPSRWWYVERPFPWPLIVGAVVVVAVTLAFGMWVVW